MAKGTINGNINLIIKIAAVLFFLGATYQMLWEMRPEVKLNTEHRIKFEEKVSTMESNIAEILKEVKRRNE